MNYYWFNRQEILQKAKERYSKEQAAEYYLKSDSHLPKKVFVICFNDSPSKMMKNPFLFHLKSSFRSQDI